MTALRTLTFAAAAAMIAGSAFAQAPAAPATPPNNSPAQAPAAAEPAPAAPPSAAAQAFRPLPTAGGQTLRATLEAAGQFSKFLAAADKTGVAPFLVSTDRQITLLVPTDVAFESVANFDALAAANPATELQRIVVRHMINARVTPDQVDGKKGPVPTVAQVNVEIDGSVMPMKVNDAVVLQANVPATNGVIYVIDKVL